MAEQRRKAQQILADGYEPAGLNRIAIVAIGGSGLIEQLLQAEPHAKLTAWFLDEWAASAARAWLAEAQPQERERVEIRESVDLPVGTWQRILLPTRLDGDGELTRELILQAWERLEPRGELWASTNNPSDQWLLAELRRWNKRTSIRRQLDGRVYVATRPETLPRTRSFSAEVVFRDGERLVKLSTRPGVFAHRKIDAGAAPCLKWRRFARETESWTLAAAQAAVGRPRVASRRDPSDGDRFNPRAVEATRWACANNGVRDYEVVLSGSARLDNSHPFDIALTNPPYYSHHRISRLMVDACLERLRVGGRLHVVTKDPRWYLEEYAGRWDEPTLQEARGYFVISTIKR
ncbi:MAG: methyltransferase [Pirellulaceae bacterium]